MSFYSAAFDVYLSLAILRAPEGLDFSGLIAESVVSPVPINPISAVPADRSAVPSVALDAGTATPSATLKPSASTASGWSDRKTTSQSQESLHSHGKNYLSFHSVKS